MRALVLPILLAACGGAMAPAPAPVPAPMPAPMPVATPTDRIATECRLLEAAQAETRARGLTAWPDVLAGCPGHPATSAMTLRQMSDATRAANAATLPAAARPLGSRADLILRRMIARGVPLDVTHAMTSTPAFAAAAR